MSKWRLELRNRLAGMNLQPARELEIIEELAQHLADRESALIREGVPPEETHLKVLDELEDLVRLRRDLEHWAPAPPSSARHSNWLGDVRYGLRMIRRRPGTSLLGVLALALGIGLTTTMFSIVEGVLLRGLPYDEQDRLVAIIRGNIQNPNSRASVPADDVLDWRAGQHSLESIEAYAGAMAVVTSASGWPEELRATRITPGLLRLLRVAPAAGRGFGLADAESGAPAVAIISHGFWQARFDERPDAVGSVIQLNGVSTTVIGIMPKNFAFPGTVDLWLPLALQRATPRNSGESVSVLGRLKPDTVLDQAAAELRVVSQQFAEAHRENRGTTAVVRPLLDESVPAQLRGMLYTMLAAVVGVMLVACVNVTNLQLARAVERTTEYSVRSALGSGMWRLVRQMLVEGLLLSAAGALLGLAIATAGIAYINHSLANVGAPSWVNLGLNGTVFLFVVGITGAATLVSSLAPGLRLARTNASDALKNYGGRGGGPRIGRLGRWLVVCEVGVSCSLLIVSGLLIRSIVAVGGISHSFATDDVLFAEIRLRSAEYPDANLWRAATSLETAIRSLPGVQQVAVAGGIPEVRSTSSVAIEGDSAIEAIAAREPVGAGYFDTLRVPILAGRAFSHADDPTAPGVAIVDEVFASRYFAGPAASLGRQVRFGERGPWRTIVGVVPALSPQASSGQIVGTIYFPFSQAPVRRFAVLARTAGDPMSMAAAVRKAAASALPDSPLIAMNSLANEYWTRAWMVRLFGGLFLTFGLAALLMSAVGLYGVMAFLVSHRTHEIGVRMALGATRPMVIRGVLRQGLGRTVLGVLIGLWPGWALASLLQELTRGASVFDPTIYLATMGVLLAVGLLATTVPALRAASVEPLKVLKQ